VDATSKIDCMIVDLLLKESNSLDLNLECFDYESNEDTLSMLYAYKWSLGRYGQFITEVELEDSMVQPLTLDSEKCGCDLPDCLLDDICKIICCDCDPPEVPSIVVTDCIVFIVEDATPNISQEALDINGLQIII